MEPRDYVAIMPEVVLGEGKRIDAVNSIVSYTEIQLTYNSDICRDKTDQQNPKEMQRV